MGGSLHLEGSNQGSTVPLGFTGGYWNAHRRYKSAVPETKILELVDLFAIQSVADHKEHGRFTTTKPMRLIEEKE